MINYEEVLRAKHEYHINNYFETYNAKELEKATTCLKLINILTIQRMGADVIFEEWMHDLGL